MTVYAITLCYNRPDIIWSSLKAYHAKATLNLGKNHYLVDNRYPLPSADEASHELKVTAATYGATLLEPGKNLGLAGGFNYALAQLNLQPDDIVIGYDGDSNPLTLGFDAALVSAIREGHDIAWASTVLPASLEQLRERGYIERTLPSGLVTWEARQAVVNSICAWPGWFLGGKGLEEPNHYYGGLEVRMWERLVSQKKKWVFLPDFREDNEIKLKTDREYVLYKWVYAHTHTWIGDFDSYLAAGCPHEDATGIQVKLYAEFERGNQFK